MIGLGLSINTANRTLATQVSAIFRGNGYDGFILDAGDISTLNQVSTGTTPVTAVTQPIGLMLDKHLGIGSSTKGVYLSGVSGTYLSTPDSMANSITGDIDISCKINFQVFPPASITALVSKYANAPNQSYMFFVTTTGTLGLFTSTNGSDGVNTVSTSAVLANFNGYVRVTHDADNGASGYDTKFYTSTDGEVWVQLGNTVTTAGTRSIYNSTTPVEIGAWLGGTTYSQRGKTYSARIYNGIRESGGTLAVEFNGTDYVTGSNLTSSTTGEIWTLNGAAYIAPDGNHALQATAAARPTWRVDASGHYYAQVLGTDDSLSCATGGGGSTGFFFCAALKPTGGAGTLRTLFSDVGTNTGYKVQLDTNNKLSFSAGDNAAFTTLASTATVDVGTTYLLTCWDDGTNLNVQINSSTAETVARPVVVGDGITYTLFKDDGAASSFAICDFYRGVYFKNSGLTAAQRASTQAFVKVGAGL